jgi:hypothetical protein
VDQSTTTTTSASGEMHRRARLLFRERRWVIADCGLRVAITGLPGSPWCNGDNCGLMQGAGSRIVNKRRCFGWIQTLLIVLLSFGIWNHEHHR